MAKPWFEGEDENKIRFSAFIDAGNVYTDQSAVDLGEVRSSYGVGMTWLTPIGPLSFSLAEPVDKRDDDKLQNFQFSISTGF